MYEVRSVSKTYGAVPALANVSFAVAAGEVHALLGMNGAGKSTLVKILVGMERPDSGSINMDGEPLTFPSAHQAADKGIAVVAQDLNVFDQLTVLANMFITREPRRFGILDVGAMRRQADSALSLVGLDVDPMATLATLSQSDKQRVAIARAILLNPKVLVLDEPTSALQPREKEKLFDVVRRLRAKGTAIVYVSHFLQEVFGIADRVTVLRDGRVVTAGVPASETTLADTVRVMAGQARPDKEPVIVEAGDPSARADNQALVVQGLTRFGEFEDVTFTATGGDILGFAGLEGSGAREVLASIFGASPASSGSAVLRDGRRIGLNMPASVRSGVAYIPADRHHSGIMPEASILDNLVQVHVATLGRGPFFLTERELSKRAALRVGQLGIKVGTLRDPLSSLSGGNQQKVLIGKWLEAEASVYLLDDPTAAVDVHARADIHAIIRALAAAGNIVVLASSDLAELSQLCSRIAVMHHGSLQTVLDAKGLTTHDLLETINTGVAPESAPIASTPEVEVHA